MMQSSPILITGGTGLLGKMVCQILDRKGVSYQIATHQKPGPINSVFMDLRTGEGMDQAIEYKNIILHLASDKTHPDHDVQGTALLLRSIHMKRKAPHFIYISIVGVEQLALPYFKQKAKVEQLVTQSGLPFSIIKATQFHEYIDHLLSSFFRFGLGLLPKKVLVQPVSVAIIAEALVALCFNNPTFQGQLLGGPEVLNIEELATVWLKAQKKSNKYVSFSLWGDTGKKLKAGVLTCPKNMQAGLSWSSWLKEEYMVNSKLISKK